MRSVLSVARVIRENRQRNRGGLPGDEGDGARGECNQGAKRPFGTDEQTQPGKLSGPVPARNRY